MTQWWIGSSSGQGFSGDYMVLIIDPTRLLPIATPTPDAKYAPPTNGKFLEVILPIAEDDVSSSTSLSPGKHKRFAILISVYR